MMTVDVQVERYAALMVVAMCVWMKLEVGIGRNVITLPPMTKTKTADGLHP